jgi:hypothetical protein
VPALVVVTFGTWSATILGAAADSSPETSPIAASLDSVARRPAVAYTAKRWLEAELVDSKERGWMEVVTRLDAGKLSHTILSEGGSSRIRSRALSSVLDKEIEACREDEARSSALSRDNYQYRVMDSPWDFVRIELMPRREDVRLVKGTALVDAGTGELIKVEGQLSRNPSFWVRDVHIARTYAQVAGTTLPVELVSTARIRMFGQARLRIRTEYLSIEGRPVAGTAVAINSAAKRPIL